MYNNGKCLRDLLMNSLEDIFFVKQGFYDIKIYEPQRHNAADAAHKGMHKKI